MSHADDMIDQMMHPENDRNLQERIKQLQGETEAPITHDLKIWPEHYDAIKRGDKTFEIRHTFDRNFKVGDTLILREWNPTTEEYTDNPYLKMTVSYAVWPDIDTIIMAFRSFDIEGQ